jgi:hypothetical protein
MQSAAISKKLRLKKRDTTATSIKSAGLLQTPKNGPPPANQETQKSQITFKVHAFQLY